MKLCYNKKNRIYELIDDCTWEVPIDCFPDYEVIKENASFYDLNKVIKENIGKVL